MSCTKGEGPGRTLGAHTLICKAWYSLLWVTSPVLGGFARNDSYHLSSTQVPIACSLGRCNCFAAAKGFVFCFVCVCVCVVCVCLCSVCVCVVCVCSRGGGRH